MNDKRPLDIPKHPTWFLLSAVTDLNVSVLGCLECKVLSFEVNAKHNVSLAGFGGNLNQVMVLAPSAPLGKLDVLGPERLTPGSKERYLRDQIALG